MILDLDQNRSKVQQLADTISSAISTGEFKEGDALPSINKISSNFDLSRDTVYKAFQKLKNKGIVESAPTKGYFVTKTVNNIFVLLDVFSSFKDDFYKELISHLPINYRIDLYFHQFNEKLFNNLIIDSLGRYDLYVVTNYINDVYYDVLDRLDNSKVLILDLGKFKKDKFSYVCQGFDNTLYDCLTSGLHLLREYNEIRFIFPLEAEHPKSCIPFFMKFCEDNHFKHELIRRKMKESDISKDIVYLLANHSDVVEFVKICRAKNLKLGEDVGLMTFNDTPMLEVIENGISAISTDFKQMGKLAAEYIKTRQKIQTYVPTRLIIRGSL
ncbi:GntR family transcriptional regulator [Bacteroidia bacterium]|nr:GntR family transcriptional regulator [Bacteroidia bacterium]GHT70034.1 GntR family transcriptional regulator [Bacteroidia bacterium]GHV32697.1 GntR family transcriptional regulator [Bacteroidia bacterium]